MTRPSAVPQCFPLFATPDGNIHAVIGWSDRTPVLAQLGPDGDGQATHAPEQVAFFHTYELAQRYVSGRGKSSSAPRARFL
jgi:hypothetical protein